MSATGAPPPPPHRVPVLTEVIAHQPGPPVAAPAAADGAEAERMQRLLEQVQRQADLLLEQRVREALAPALARFADALVQEVREELASALRDIVSRAVAQELSRHRER